MNMSTGATSVEERFRDSLREMEDRYRQFREESMMSMHSDVFEPLFHGDAPMTPFYLHEQNKPSAMESNMKFVKDDNIYKVSC